MDLTRAKVLLKKMNRLVEGMDSDDHLTAIEKDLMRAYLRDLYDFFLNDFSQGPKEEASRTTESMSDQHKADKEVRRKSASQEEQTDDRTSGDDLSIPRIQPESDQEPPPEPDQGEPLSQADTPVQSPEETQEEDLEQAAGDSPNQSDEEIEELFDIREGNELSERLSHMPIRDLSRAMGLNERIYTINELFGGDHALFDEVLETLNNLDSFKEARDYLTDKVAKKYNWTQPDKKKKAHHFIRLVRRRYKRQVV